MQHTYNTQHTALRRHSCSINTRQMAEHTWHKNKTQGTGPKTEDNDNNKNLLEKSRNPWSGNRWPAASSSLVCSRDLPVCRHRSVLFPPGIPTHGTNQPVLRRYRQSELVSHRIRTNAKFSLQQQTPDYFFKWFPLSNNLLQHNPGNQSSLYGTSGSPPGMHQYKNA